MGNDSATRPIQDRNWKRFIGSSLNLCASINCSHKIAFPALGIGVFDIQLEVRSSKN